MKILITALLQMCEYKADKLSLCIYLSHVA